MTGAARDYEISFLELEGKEIGWEPSGAYYSWTPVARWNVILAAYTAEDALKQFDVSHKTWWGWSGVRRLEVVEIQPARTRDWWGIELLGPECGPKLWRDHTLVIPPGYHP